MRNTAENHHRGTRAAVGCLREAFLASYADAVKHWLLVFSLTSYSSQWNRKKIPSLTQQETDGSRNIRYPSCNPTKWRCNLPGWVDIMVSSTWFSSVVEVAIIVPCSLESSSSSSTSSSSPINHGQHRLLDMTLLIVTKARSDVWYRYQLLIPSEN